MIRGNLFAAWYWLVTILVGVGLTWPLLQWIVTQQLVPATSKLIEGGAHPGAVVVATWSVMVVIAAALACIAGPSWLARGELLWFGQHSGHDIAQRAERRSIVAQSVIVGSVFLAGIGWAAALPMAFGYRFAIAAGSGLCALAGVRIIAFAQRLDVKDVARKWCFVVGSLCAVALYGTVGVVYGQRVGLVAISTVTIVTLSGAVVIALGIVGAFGWGLRRMISESVFDRPGSLPPQWELLTTHENLSRIVTSVQAVDLTLVRGTPRRPAGMALSSCGNRSFGSGIATLAWRPMLSPVGLSNVLLLVPLPGVVWFLWGQPAGFAALMIVLYLATNRAWRLLGSWLISKPVQRLFSANRRQAARWLVSPLVVVVLILAGWAHALPMIDIPGVIVILAIIGGAWYRGFLAASGRLAQNYDVAVSPAGVIPIGVIQKSLAGTDVLVIGTALMLKVFTVDHLRLVAASLLVALALSVWLSRAFSLSSKLTT